MTQPDFETLWDFQRRKRSRRHTGGVAEEIAECQYAAYRVDESRPFFAEAHPGWSKTRGWSRRNRTGCAACSCYHSRTSEASTSDVPGR